MRVDGSGLEAIWSGYRCTELHIWTPAIGLLPLSLQGLAGNRPAEPAWQPGVGAREEVPKGASQALTDNKSYSLPLWSVQLSIGSFKSLLTKIINMEEVLFAYLVCLGKA